MSMHECMDEPEDADPATICSGILGRVGPGLAICYRIAISALSPTTKR